ncbi:MAG TPA: ATP-binding cassette domain-containing protein [Bacillales bacterium]
MALLETDGLTFHYPDGDRPALDGVSLALEPGEFVVLCGPSGCGKTTLLRMLKKEIAPAGEAGGRILYKGKQLGDHSKEKQARDIAMVFQDPENQIVMDEVMQELVFGMENLGFSTDVMRKRVAEMAHFFGLEPWLHRRTHEISGGQKQMLNLASVLLLNPRVLLLDEPTAQLDPVAAKDFIHMVHRLNQEFGLTVLMVEHRLEELFPLADRAVMMREGYILYDDEPRKVAGQIWEQEDQELRHYLPAMANLYLEQEYDLNAKRVPLTVREGREWVRTVPYTGETSKKTAKTVEKPLLKAKNVRFQYEKGGNMVLENLNLNVYPDELLAVVGGNGSGKSTLLKMMAGLLKPQVGKIVYQGKKLKKQPLQDIAYLPQNPKLYFLHDTVEAEMEEAASRFGQETQGKIERLTMDFGISGLIKRHPYDLSGGEMQKAALVCVLLQEPKVLLVDEPTKGLDPVAKQHFGELLTRLHSEEVTIVMVSHDVEFAAKYATRCAMMFEGEITVTGSPGEFFKGNNFYTTMINRITRDSPVPEVLTLEEARKTWRIHDSFSV